MRCGKSSTRVLAKKLLLQCIVEKNGKISLFPWKTFTQSRPIHFSKLVTVFSILCHISLRGLITCLAEESTQRTPASLTGRVPLAASSSPSLLENRSVQLKNSDEFYYRFPTAFELRSGSSRLADA